MGKVAVFIGVAVAIGVAIVVIGGILSLDTATEERLVDVDFNLAEVKSEVMEDVVQLKRLDEELKRQRQVQVGHRAQIQQLQQQQNAMVAKLDGSVRTLEKSIAQLSANVSHVSEPLKKASEGCALFPSERVCVRERENVVSLPCLMLLMCKTLTPLPPPLCRHEDGAVGAARQNQGGGRRPLQAARNASRAS